MRSFALLASLAVCRGAYTCLNTKNPGDAHNCDGATPATSSSITQNTGEEFTTFGMKMCCRPGSGGSPKFVGFNCQCPDVVPGTCVDDITGQIFAKAGETCFNMLEKGGGKDAACGKFMDELSAEAASKGVPHLRVDSPLACAKSCGKCECKDDADGLVSSKAKTTCAALKEKGGCEGKLSEMDDTGKVPKIGLKVQDVCPETCGFCHKSEVATSLSADGALSNSNSASTVVIVAGVIAGVAIVVAFFIIKARRASVEAPALTPTTLAQL